MWLQSLQAQRLRSFQQCELTFAPGINILYGDNGVGKTSILEGISLLSCGKSFRTNSLSHIISHNSSDLVLYGEVNNINGADNIGVQLACSQKKLRLNQESVSRWADLAKILPVLDIHPESYLLITGSPQERRRFLNWGVFHVEPSFSQLWSNYSKALKQRNFCLRTHNIKEARNWHNVLSDNGQHITQLLDHYCSNLMPHITDVLAKFNIEHRIQLKFSAGWDVNLKLEDILDAELNVQELPLSTHNGPHRCDLKIYWEDRLFSKSSSRGQQKVMAMALKLAQAKLMQESYQKRLVYLIDELPAELDDEKKSIAFDILGELQSQVIISAVSKDSMQCLGKQVKWFHVKHGSVSAVV